MPDYPAARKKLFRHPLSFRSQIVRLAAAEADIELVLVDVDIAPATETMLRGMLQSTRAVGRTRQDAAYPVDARIHNAAGFLLTAVRNWTGLPTPTGPLLAALAATWLLPRVLVTLGPGPLARGR